MRVSFYKDMAASELKKPSMHDGVQAFLRFVCQRSAMVIIAVLLLISYFTSYGLRRQLGLAHPMANMSYYYYGSDPNTLSDRALYWFYCPASLFGDRLGVHWRNARPPYDPSYF
jgi:hypothetical protein